jgi:hypothetical protein
VSGETVNLLARFGQHRGAHGADSGYEWFEQVRERDCAVGLGGDSLGDSTGGWAKNAIPDANTSLWVTSGSPRRMRDSQRLRHESKSSPDLTTGDDTKERRHRVAIVGAGFGGLFAAKALRRAEFDVTVVDRTNHPLLQPLLYQMASGILAECDIAPPMPDILRRQGSSVVLGG